MPKFQRHMPRRAMAGPTAIHSGPPVQYDEDLFWYVVAFGNMTTGLQTTQQLTIQADSHFEWVKTSYYATLSTGLAPFQWIQYPEITLQIQDNGSGRNLTFGAVPVPCIAGNGGEPYINPVARIFEAKTTVGFTAVNLSNTNQYNTFTLVLGGRKLFPMG